MQFALQAADTLLLVNDLSHQIAAGRRIFGHSQNLFWAYLNADSATLAKVISYLYCEFFSATCPTVRSFGWGGGPRRIAGHSIFIHLYTAQHLPNDFHGHINIVLGDNQWR